MPNIVLTQFATANTSTSAASGGVLDALGIDWQMLVFQMIGFLILVWVMAKFIYPIFMKQVDARQAKIDESLKAAKEAEELAAQTAEKTAKLLKQARKDADDIVATAKAEAGQMVEGAEKKSRERAERIMSDAEAQIEKSVASAQQALRKETLELVAEATERVVGSAVTQAVDKKVIKHAVEEAKR